MSKRVSNTPLVLPEGHTWEGKEQQCTSAESVDGPHGRPSEDEVDQAETPRSELQESALVTQYVKRPTRAEVYEAPACANTVDE